MSKAHQIRPNKKAWFSLDLFGVICRNRFFQGVTENPNNFFLTLRPAFFGMRFVLATAAAARGESRTASFI
jgi:hypothetical protein